MSISSITSQVSNAEQYVIRSAKREQTSQPEQQVQQVQTDEYDKGNPVGEATEGIYSVSHDDEGNLKVNYTQRSEKSLKTEAKTEASNETGRSSGVTTDSDDEEIETLKKQRDQLKAQLNRETDEEVKRTLRVQLQSIEVQIAMKNSGVN